MAAIASATAVVAATSLTLLESIADCGRSIRNLESNLTALKIAMAVLDTAYEELNKRVIEAELQGWIRKTEVRSWLTTVEGLDREVGRILADGNKMMESGCLCGLNPVNIFAHHSQSKLAEDKKVVLEAALQQGHNFQTRDAFARESDALTSLNRSLEKLQGFYDTVKQRVQTEEQQGDRVRTPQVSDWFRRVEDLLKEGNSQPQRNNNQSYDECAKGTMTILGIELYIGGEIKVFTIKSLMREKPLDISKVSNTAFEGVLQWVQDEDGKVRRIGLYGMGGVGKTTLLKRIYNELLPAQRNYDMIAWITVSRATNYKVKIQEALWKNLNLGDWDVTAEDERAEEIFKRMKKKRCLLFLDDIWQWDGEISDLGIPSESKIIFTTRSKRVCGLLQSDRTEEVKCLPPKEALKLLKARVPKETWSKPGIPELAMELVEVCKYLPLALVTVGTAMSSREDFDEWKLAADLLRKGASHFEGMGEKVLSVLEFSYEALEDETRKKCFLYCSIFPEGYEFRKDQLVDLWIGAGFLESCGKISAQRDHGTEVLNNLRRACLLEDSTDKYGAERIRMHDLVREMGLWVASEHGKEANKVIVQVGLTSFEPSEVRKWEDAEIISLWRTRLDKKIRNCFRSMPHCSRLSTLIIRESKLKTFPLGFFSCMPSLRILDLSRNSYLAALPSDIELAELRYLNLMATSIREVPLSIKKGMPKLVVLLVHPGCCVPAGLLPSLPSLRVFGTIRSLGERNSIAAHESALIDELRGMDGIEDVGLYLGSAECVRSVVMKEPWLQRCLGQLQLVGCSDMGPLLISSQAASEMKHLRDLQIRRCSFSCVLITDEPSIRKEDPFRSLEKITITDCAGLLEVTDLIWYAPRLTDLLICNCGSMQELVARDVDDRHANRVFSRLSLLGLYGLPKLNSICRTALPFPSLNRMVVAWCPNLKKLPFDCSSGGRAPDDNSLEIHGDNKWWEGLEWDDPETKRLFSDKFFLLSRKYMFNLVPREFHGHIRKLAVKILAIEEMEKKKIDHQLLLTIPATRTVRSYSGRSGTS